MNKKGTSLAHKFSFGFYLLLGVAVLIFVVSAIFVSATQNAYRNSMDGITRINALYANVEANHNNVYSYSIMLRETSNTTYQSSSETLRTMLAEVRAENTENYTRDVEDLCNLVDSYQFACDTYMHLGEQLKTGRGVTTEMLTAQYGVIQQIYGYINQSFGDTYSQLLQKAQVLQGAIRRSTIVLYILFAALLATAIYVCVDYQRKTKREVLGNIGVLTQFAAGVTQKGVLSQEEVLIDSEDELEMLANAFNRMMRTIRSQMQELENSNRTKEQLQQAEVENLRISSALQLSRLRLLQSRINPHFLFNTLNMITQTAYIEDATETAKLMEVTADFLRYNLSKLEKTVTVGQEVENAEKYIYIQQCRFGERIQFSYDLDDACTPYNLPCMVLQPLVENAVKHGVGSLMRGGIVTIRSRLQDEKVLLEVADNGVGIPPQKLQKMREDIISGDMGKLSEEHIGVRNVYQRLYLHFNGEVTFAIDSDESKGTRVCVTFPAVAPDIQEKEI